MKSFRQYINLIFFLLFFTCKPNINLAPLPIGGDFSYADKSGKVISLKNYSEPVLLVFFGYTQCPDFCPNLLTKIKSVRNQLPDTIKFRVVFISIDPKRDDSNVTQKYIEFYFKDATGLSFNESTTNLLVKKYAAYVEANPDGQTIDHSTYVYVLDKDRKTRALLKSNDSLESYKDVILSLSSDSI
ncbi:SCO1/SenC [Leptospira ryugenii]|uniref:SCO1/SenC n=1 Tax=Leptospira ryugenii TaxID=1917863 RepID=A0A2P2E0R4_9LEPT|nr:SCO family protein [Leptospira ryugenii]GBF50478.1 SCO1/SenC [Leptospira ryugenii]